MPSTQKGISFLFLLWAQWTSFCFSRWTNLLPVWYVELESGFWEKILLGFSFSSPVFYLRRKKRIIPALQFFVVMCMCLLRIYTANFGSFLLHEPDVFYVLLQRTRFLSQNRSCWASVELLQERHQREARVLSPRETKRSTDAFLAEGYWRELYTIAVHLGNHLGYFALHWAHGKASIMLFCKTVWTEYPQDPVLGIFIILKLLWCDFVLCFEINSLFAIPSKVQRRYGKITKVNLLLWSFRDCMVSLPEKITSQQY